MPTRPARLPRNSPPIIDALEPRQFLSTTTIVDPILEPIVAGIKAKPAPKVRALTLTVNNVNITDGSTDPVDFGSVLLGQPAPTRTFTLTNTGTADLKLGKVTLPSGFILVGSDLPATLKPKKVATFTVRMITDRRATRSARISFTSNVLNQAIFDFAINGRVIAPQIQLMHASQTITGDSPTVRFGKVSTKAKPISFDVTNVGEAPLALDAFTVPQGFTCTHKPANVLNPGQTDTLAIRLNTKLLGTHAGKVRFNTNDPETPTFAFTVSGKVVGVTATRPPRSVSMVVVTGTPGPDRITISGTSASVNVIANGRSIGHFSSVAKIIVDSAGGDDVIDLSGASVPVTVFAGGGGDRIVGGEMNDELHGGFGNDSISGGEGADKLFGDEGDDTLNAIDGSPDKILDGGAGTNRVLRDPTDPS